MASEFPIVIKLGGRESVTEKLRRRGHELGDDALRMWVTRGRIPGDALPMLMEIAEAERVAYCSQDFVLVDVPESVIAKRPKRRAVGT